MVKPEWGTKRICKKCSASFYDLGRDPITCPKCLSSFSASDFTSRYTKGEKVETRRESKRPLEEEVPDILEDNEIIEDPDLIEDEDDFDSEMSLIERPENEEDR